MSEWLNFLNRGKPGAAEQPADRTQDETPAPRPRRAVRQPRRGARDGERPPGDAVATEQAASEATPPPRRRAPRAAGGSAPAGAQRPRSRAATESRDPSTPTADEQAAIEAAIKAQLTAGEATPATPAAPEGPRRRRPRASGRPPASAATSLEAATREVETPAPEAAASPAADGATRTGRDQPSRRGGRGRGGRRDSLPPAQARPEQAPPRNGARGGGSVESLIARQNVLFEEFANQQAQTLREIQRGMQNAGRGGRSGDAVAPIVLPKVGVFLDVPNVIYAAEDAGVRVDFGKLLDFLTRGRQLVRATAYAPVTDDPNTRYENQRFVYPVLGQGYKVVTKPWKRFADGGMKANFDIELAVDILTMSDRLDIVVLLSGDSDFKRVIELVESKGVRVEVCAFAQSTANELRAVADQYIDLGSILQHVGA